MPSADTGASTARVGARATVPDSTVADPDSDAHKLLPGSSGYRRVSLALFAAGLAAFALLYSTQALLPSISADLHASADVASWTVSGATLGLALAVLPLSALSERFGRRRMMTVSLAVAVALAATMPFAPSLGWLIALRVAQGAAVAGIPASAMAFLSEEVRSTSLAGAVGLFIAGNSIGGMSGRILTGWITEAGGWRAGLVAAAVSAALCAVAFRLLVPQSRHFSPTPLHPRNLAKAVRGHVANPLLVRLFLLGMLFMTVFGAVYTVIGYRLVSDEFGLSQGVAGSIFVIYLVGTFSSAAAGKLVGRLGRRSMLYVAIGTAAAGLLLTLADSLTAVTGGLVLITAGFFAGHSVASGAVSRTATTDRAQAAALYQMSYYLGSSIGGAVGALAYRAAGWDATAAFALTALVAAAGVTLYATRRAVLDRRALATAR